MWFVARSGATAAERAASLPGDDLLPRASFVLDRATTLPGDPAAVWPWIVQLGKGRAGWYLGHPVDRLVPQRNRGSRTIDEGWQRLSMGDVVPDYGPGNPTFTVAEISPPHTLVYRSTRGKCEFTWELHLSAASASRTRLHVRFRMQWGDGKSNPLLRAAGDAMDWFTIGLLFAGLRERVDAAPID